MFKIIIVTLLLMWTSFAKAQICPGADRECKNFGGTVYCGYSCENFGGTIYCGNAAGETCENFGGTIYCGSGCDNFGGTIYCATGGKGQPAKRALPAQ